ARRSLPLLPTGRSSDLADAAPGFGGFDSPEAGVDVEVATAGKCAVDDRVLKDDAADAAGGEWLARDVEAGHARAATGRGGGGRRSGEHTTELQPPDYPV